MGTGHRTGGSGRYNNNAGAGPGWLLYWATTVRPCHGSGWP